jgi:hypothetical protein
MLPEEFVEYAEIIEFVQPNPLTGEYIYSFEWKGSAHAPVRIGCFSTERILADPAFPFSLKQIGEDRFRGFLVFVRTDVPINFKVIQFLENRWFKHCRAFNYFQARIIMTLHVWGLAYAKPYENPSWGCVGKKR